MPPILNAVTSNPVVPVWKSIAKSAFGRSSRLNRSPACRLGAVAPFSFPGHSRFHVNQIDASALIGPSALHAFQGRTRHVRDRHHRTRHPRRIELAHHGLDRMHRTHLVAMHATGQDAALARLCSLGDRHRHIPVLSGWHLNALEIQKVLLAGLQIVDVKRADDLLSVYRVSGKGGSPRCRRCLRTRGVRVGRERS